MEQYTFNCAACGANYNYTGFKTGIGKTAAQLKQMSDERHVCRKCGYDDRTGDSTMPNTHSLDMSEEANAAGAFAAAALTQGEAPVGCKQKDHEAEKWASDALDKMNGGRIHDIYDTLSMQLTKARVEAGLTVRELADASELDTEKISAMERGDPGSMDIHGMIRVAKALGQQLHFYFRQAQEDSDE